MQRLHRIRSNKNLRDLYSSNFNYKKFIQPIFIFEKLQEKEPVPYLEHVYRDTEKTVFKQIENDIKHGVSHFLLFLIPKEKSNSKINSSFYSKMISNLKKEFTEVFFWIDTCLCSTTTHGHCCLFDENQKIDNQRSIELLSELALIYVDSGADGIAPSNMMDGRVKSHREILDKNGHISIPIMSYSTKFKSNFYGPFRDALDSAPKFGDRAKYQIDVRNHEDAVLSSIRDAKEQADFLMVKPAMTSIDLISEIKKKTMLPIGSYQVSGEYASLCMLYQNQLANFEEILLETWNVFVRAGSSFIISYAARRGRELFL